MLTYLIENRGRLVTKDELFDEVWGTRFVSETSLTSRIRAARKAVGDSGSKQTIIRTVRGRGYEFIAEVTEHEALPPEPATPPVTAEPQTQSRGSSSLPVSMQALIGRDVLLRELRDELARFRLVTLIGPGGVGKTTVAYELARSLEAAFPDGVHDVEFVTVDASATVEALATSLDVQTRADASLEDAVVDMLRSRHALLLLDSCEHLLEPLAALVDRIVQAAPEVAVIATSRQPLAVRGERLWPVEPLPVGDEQGVAAAELREVPAIKLFAERAGAANPRFDLDDAALESVARICRRLDGMPLAIELAAARVRTLGVREIEEHLDERFRLLRSPRRGGDPRHQTLYDAVQWSYDLLDPEERRVFDELSTFAGQFDLAAATAICGDTDELDTLDRVTSLAERSMLVVREPQSGELRYEMLETLRDYGRPKLDKPMREELASRHSMYYAKLAADVALSQRGPDEPTANARAEASFADLRAALRFAVSSDDADTALRLVSSLREYAMRSMRYEALGWADDALSCGGAVEHALHASVKGVKAYGAWLRGEFGEALTLANEVEQEESRRHELGCGLAQRVQANVLYVQGDVEDGLAAGRRQLDLAEEADDPSRVVHGAYMMSVALSSVGEREEASELAQRAKLIAEESHSPTDLASALAAVGFAAYDEPETAIGAFEECDRLARQAGNRWMSAFARTELSSLLLVNDQPVPAFAGLADAVDTWYRAGEWSQQWLTLARCVVALTTIDEHELAAQLIGGIERRATMGVPPVIASLRERTLAEAEDLRTRLGDEQYAELRDLGETLPVVDLVHRTRAALLGQRSG